MKQLYIIEYENAQWRGGRLYCTVMATSTEEAEDLAENFMQEKQRELFAEDYEDAYYEGVSMDASAVSVTSVELMKDSEHNEFYSSEQKNYFYPLVPE